MAQTSAWGIIGLGWLGTELAASLTENKISHWGTRTCQFNWHSDPFPQADCDFLFLNTPPLTDIPPNVYAEKIPLRNYRHLLFISSTSVYGLAQGVVTESSPASPETSSAQWLVQVENLLLEKFKGQVTVIRPGGLIGGHRHPVKNLSAKAQEVYADDPINFIHRKDLIGLVMALSAHAAPPKLINAVSPFHPTKKDYYSFWTKKLGLPPLTYLPGVKRNLRVNSEHTPHLYPTWVCPLLDELNL